MIGDPIGIHGWNKRKKIKDAIFMVEEKYVFFFLIAKLFCASSSMSKKGFNHKLYWFELPL